MKYIGLYLGIWVLLAVSAGRAHAQYIDTACIGDKHVKYFTGARAGSTFTWTVEGGVIDSSSADGSVIWVNWGNVGGPKKITVKERTKEGCPADPVLAYVLLWPIGPVAIFGPDLVCKGIPVTLEAVGDADRYLWNTGDTTPKLSVNPSTDTTFSVVGYFGQCGSKTSLHDLRVKYRPVADFTFNPNEPIIYEDIQFQYTGSNNVDDWSWAFSEGNRQVGQSNQTDPTYTFTQPGIKAIKLTVKNNFGCTDTITKYIAVEAGIRVFIPTSFTPNGDGFNNVFKPVYENVIATEFSILDRWGEIMFKTHSMDEGWDGRYKNQPVPDGVFAYLVKVTGKDNKNYVFNGTVTVLR